MEKSSLLLKIKSKYLVDNIFEYVEYKNFDLKLFMYSKSAQKYMNIKLLDYQMNSPKTDLYIDKYFYSFLMSGDYLNTLLQKDMKEYNFDLNTIYDFYYKNMIKSSPKKYSIHIESPFFNFFAKNNFLEKYFRIILPIAEIKRHNLENDYINAFIKLNSKYSSIEFEYHDISDINYLKTFNINFNKIKHLVIKQSSDYNKIITYNYSTFFNTLFSFNNIFTTLEYLFLGIDSKFNPQNIREINKFQSLKELILSNIKFDSLLILDIKNLEILELICCSNIFFSKALSLNLKQLILKHATINNHIKFQLNTTLKFPNLIKYINDSSNDYDSLIYFPSLIKLKVFVGQTPDYMRLKDLPSIEEIYLRENNFPSTDEFNMIKEIILNISLKKVYFEILNITKKEISKIKGMNPSVEVLAINWRNRNYSIEPFMSFFPNISELYISDYLYSSNVEIKSKYSLKNSKHSNKPYGNLKLVKFNVFDTVIEQNFPLFKTKSPIFFNSLEYFDYYGKIDKYILNNLYNNIENMPNLKSLRLDIRCQNIKESFIQKLLIKLKTRKMLSIYLKINNKNINLSNIEYTMEDLVEFKDYTGMLLMPIVKLIIFLILFYLWFKIKK